LTCLVLKPTIYCLTCLVLKPTILFDLPGAQTHNTVWPAWFSNTQTTVWPAWWSNPQSTVLLAWCSNPQSTFLPALEWNKFTKNNVAYILQWNKFDNWDSIVVREYVNR
jgi:hypothetical protein